MGMNLFVIQAQAPDNRAPDIYRGILPFRIAPFMLLVAMFALPQLALWLPTLLDGSG